MLRFDRRERVWKARTDLASTQGAFILDPTAGDVDVLASLADSGQLRGRLTGVQGALELSDVEPSRSALILRAAAVVFGSGGDPARRGARVHGRIRSLRLPEIVFRSRRVGIAPNGELRIAGDATVAGVTRPAVVDARLAARWSDERGEGVTIVATTLLRGRDFGLEGAAWLDDGIISAADRTLVCFATDWVRADAGPPAA